MALPPLAQFSRVLFPPTGGKAYRLKLNQDTATFKSGIDALPGIKGDDLKAFLTFAPVEVARRVLDRLIAQGSFKDNYEDFAAFVREVGKYQFPQGEEPEYGHGADGGDPVCKPPATMGGKYNFPKCQIYMVDALPPANGVFDLKICGEGFLAGATVRIMQIFEGGQDPVQVGPDRIVSPQPNSTFRYGQLLIKDLGGLASGKKHKVVVLNDCGDQVVSEIDTPVNGTFTAP